MPDEYRRGGFYRIDDRTGFRVRADRTRKEWNGAIVDRDDFEPRHPQDFVRARVDRQAVSDPRPEPADQFLQRTGDAFFMVHDDAAGANTFLLQTDPDGVISIMAYEVDTRTGADL